MSKKQNLEKALAELGIKSEADLQKAIADLPALNLYIMTAPKQQERKAS